MTDSGYILIAFSALVGLSVAALRPSAALPALRLAVSAALGALTVALWRGGGGETLVLVGPDLFFDAAFAPVLAVDTLTRVTAIVATLLVAMTPPHARGRAGLFAALTLVGAAGQNPFVLVIAAGVQGQVLAAASGVQGKAAAFVHRAGDLLGGLGLAALGLERQGLAAAAFFVAALLRIGAPPAAAASTPLFRGDASARVLEMLLGPAFLSLLLCIRTAGSFVAEPGLALVVDLLALAAAATGLAPALLARRRGRVLFGLRLIGFGLVLLLIGLGAPVVATSLLFAQILALTPLVLVAEALRRVNGHDRVDSGRRVWDQHPVIASAAALAAASLVGAPPLLGFTVLDAARWRAIAAGPGHGWLLWGAVVALGIGHAAAAARLWRLGFFSSGRSLGARASDRASGILGVRIVVATLLLLLAAAATTPQWSGGPDFIGSRFAAALGVEATSMPARANRTGPPAAGLAFGLIGAMATLAGLYLGHRFVARDEKEAARFRAWDARDPARRGAVFLRERILHPLDRIARGGAEGLVERRVARGVRQRLVAWTSAAGQRVAALQSGDAALYASIALVTLLLFLLSWAR